MPITGECFCGQVAYQINGQLKDARSCHCSRCRKVSGTQGSAYALVEPDDFAWLQGESLLTSYVGQHNFGLQFCRVCGSTLCGVFEGQVHGIMLGSLNDDPKLEIGRHIYVDSKAQWEQLPSNIGSPNIVAHKEGPDSPVVKISSENE